MNRRIPLRIAGLLGVALALASAGFAASAQTEDSAPSPDSSRLTPDASRLTSFEIPPQPLSDALILFGDQSGRDVMADSDVTNTLDSPGFTGQAEPEAALQRLLEGTGLIYRQDGDVFVIVSPASSSVAGQNTIGQRRPGIEEIIVTGQKREERIQDVPIAISAFSPEDLEAQKIEGGFDLLKGVPNVTFSKTNFTSYNFQIRGIGTQAISATTDPGVAVSFNNTTLIVNRLFEQEYLDVERVEVLRGPQGTLFGRNATAGVINVISKKPELGVWDGMIDVEVGNYNTRRLRGFVNAPIGDEFAIRGAYASTKRDGYGINEAASDPLVLDSNRPKGDVDNRDLWTGRLTLGWQPNDRVRADLLFERFEEDDRRVRTSKQLCKRDPAPQTIGSYDWDDPPPVANPLAGTVFRPLLSQGCLPTSLYSDDAYGTPNGASLPFITALLLSADLGKGMGGNQYYTGPHRVGAPDPNPPCELATLNKYANPLTLCSVDPYGGLRQSRDLRTIYSLLDPEYRAEADILELTVDVDLSDSLTFTSQTVYVSDEIYATQDFNRYKSFPVFNDGAQACDLFSVFGLVDFVTCEPDAELFPGFPTPGGRGTFADGLYADLQGGGVFDDPQLGPSRTMVAQDLSEAVSRQFNQEFRLVSNFTGDLNFSLGANFTRFETQNDYFVFSNALTLLTNYFPYNTAAAGGSWCFRSNHPEKNPAWTADSPCVYVDPNPLEDINGEGHNYFRSDNPYELTSSALFGELYWQATDTLKFTIGARMSWDQKIFTPIPSQLLLYDFRRFVEPGEGPEDCDNTEVCKLTGTGVDNGEGARGSVPEPDIVQEWREPTGRLVVDWQPVLDFTDETLLYASFSRGYKGGGANPPTIAPPAGFFLGGLKSAEAPRTFEPEFINAYELGTKNTLFDGALTFNGAAFYYDYTDYQVSKIVDRSANNENFDVEIWGLEIETIFAPSLAWQFNATIGYLNTEVAEGERSIDLMDRTQGGNRSFTGGNGNTYDEWLVLKPWITDSSNCIVPADVIEALLQNGKGGSLISYCPGGGVLGDGFTEDDLGNLVPGIGRYNPVIDAPNRAAGFFADLGGNELPNAPEFTVALGAQYNFDLTRDWRATARVDYYWQDQSFARIYNTEFDRLKSWSNTNLSFWVTHQEWGITVEGYVKNVFDETPITGTFLNSDDSALTTNVFTLDPRLIGFSIRKEF